MSSPSVITLAHLTCWRELRARGPLLLILVSCLVIDLLLPLRHKGPWEIFSLLIVLPPTALGLALRMPSSADSFWRGLGGSGVARGAVTATVHLAPLLTTAGLLLWSLHGRGETLGAIVDLPESITDLSYLTVLTALYALVFAGRSVAGGMRALSLLVAAGPALWLVAQAAQYVNKWPAWHGLMLRVFVLAVIALICGALLEGSVGAWGGMVRKRAPSTGALLASLLCFSGFSIAAEAAWPASWSFDGDRWAVLAPDGSSAVIGWWNRGMARGLKWSQEDGLSWGDKDDLDRWSVYPGPRGATVARGSITWPSGAVTTCDSDIYVYSEACWDPNGDALFLSLRHSRRFAMATPNGCALLSRDIQRPQFLPDGDVVFLQENELFAGKDIASATRIPVPGHESTTGTLWFESNRRTTYVARQTTEGDAASMEHTVWQLNAGALTQLMTGAGKPRLWNECVWTSGPGTANARESKTISCWTPAGEPLFKEYSTDRRMLPIGHGWLFDSGRFIGEFSGREVEAGLFRPSDGMKIPLPRHGSRLRWNGDFALLGPKQLRLISPDGSIKDIALPPE